MAKYYIEFSVAADKKSIRAISVALDSETITNIKLEMSVDLVNHPLYATLEKYVLANPSRKGSELKSTGKH